jgi:hypothetical protein
MKDDVSLNIANSFLQILFNKENLKVQKEQLSVDEKQLARTQTLVDAGMIARGDLLDVQAPVASDKQRIIAAENVLFLSKLGLAQLLQLTDYQNFDVEDSNQLALQTTTVLDNPTAVVEKAKADSVISYISAQRREQINLYGPHSHRHSGIESKYGKYLFVPLALPVFEVPDKEHFFAWWNTNMAVTKKLDGDAVMSGYGIAPFETIDIVNEIGNQWWEANNQRESFKKEFPKLWQQFNDYLPLENILRLTFWSSRHAIQEHRDSAEFMDTPGSLRVMLYDDNPEETLYIFDNELTVIEPSLFLGLNKLETLHLSGNKLTYELGLGWLNYQKFIEKAEIDFPYVDIYKEFDKASAWIKENPSQNRARNG